jgi:uncharacterized protein Smg (DUF494 family)
MREDEGITPTRVVGLVMQLLREIRENHLQVDDVEFLSIDLLSQGYTKSEINAAFSWLYARLDGTETADILYLAGTDSLSFRVLHPAEHAVIRPEAHGLLIEMFTIGMLSLEDLERVIERAMAFGGPLGQEEINMIVHSYLFEEAGWLGHQGSMQFTQPSNTVN